MTALASSDVPIFDGTNEYRFREELAKLYSRIKLMGSKATDDAIIEYIIAHCFPGAEHVRSTAKEWQRVTKSAKQPILFVNFLNHLKDVWGYANTTVTLQHLYALSHRYKGMPITNPWWEGIVANFKRLQSRMATKPTDPEMVDFVMAPMSDTMKNGVAETIYRFRQTAAIKASMAAASGSTAASVLVESVGGSGIATQPTEGAPSININDVERPFTLDEVEAAVRSYLKVMRQFTVFGMEERGAGVVDPVAEVLAKGAFGFPGWQSGFGGGQLGEGFGQMGGFNMGHQAMGGVHGIDVLGGVGGENLEKARLEEQSKADNFARLMSTPPPKNPAQPQASTQPGKQVRFADPKQDQALQDLTLQFQDMKLFVNKVNKQLDVLTNAILKPSQAVKAKNPPGEKTATGLFHEVDSMVMGTAASQGVRCYYCGLPGHYKDQCEILVKDILAGAKVIIAPDRRLHWVVTDVETGVRKLGEEVKGHREGARHHVMEVGEDPTYQAALSQVDFSLTIEGYAFSLGSALATEGTPRCKSPPGASEPVVTGETTEEILVVEVQSFSPSIAPSDVSEAEALRVVESLNMEGIGKPGDGVPVWVICEEVAKARGTAVVDVQVKRVRDPLDEGEQPPRVAIDWPPKPGQAVVYPRRMDRPSKTTTIEPTILQPRIPLPTGIRTGTHTNPTVTATVPTVQQDVDEDAEMGEEGDAQGKRSRRRKKKKSLGAEKSADKATTLEAGSVERGGSVGPGGSETVNEAGIHLTQGELLVVIDKLFNQSVDASMTWGQFLAFSPRAVRMVMDRIKARKVPFDAIPEGPDGMAVDEAVLAAFNTKAVPEEDMYDRFLSCFLDEIDLDKVTGGKITAERAGQGADGVTVESNSLDVVNVMNYKVSVDDVLSFSTELAEEDGGEFGRPEHNYETRCKVCPTSKSVLGPDAVYLEKVTLDGGSQVITETSWSGARLPVGIFGFTYFVQAFIIDDRIDPKPPFGLLLGQPFLDLARAETSWSENGDQWTRFRSQQDPKLTLKAKTVDLPHLRQRRKPEGGPGRYEGPVGSHGHASRHPRPGHNQPSLNEAKGMTNKRGINAQEGRASFRGETGTVSEWGESDWTAGVDSFTVKLDGAAHLEADGSTFKGVLRGLAEDGWDVATAMVGVQGKLGRILKKKGVLGKEDSVSAVVTAAHSMDTRTLLKVASLLREEGVASRPLDCELLDWCGEVAGLGRMGFGEVLLRKKKGGWWTA
ncbi:hypothetical protein BC829DRAFT_420208 [Chytridium lagenaria]|nr:hypothetical protein BC829DRAFT_420208 [Chytridium lagenaria]